MAKEIQDQFADVDIFDDLTIREQPEGMKVVDALLDLKNRLNLQQGDSLSENIDNAIESLMLEEINKRQNFLRVRKNPEMPEKQSYILEKELPVDVFDRTTVYAKEKRIPFQSETVPEVGVQFVKKFQEGGATELPSLQEQYQDEDIFDTESRLARITEGLEPSASVEPVELTPAEERVAGLAGLLQKGGERGVPLLGTFEDPRQAYQMSQKLLRLVDPRQQGGMGEFLPGFSYELAREREDPLGQGLSLLDLIPGGGLIKPGVKATKEAIEKADKGIKSLPPAQQKIQQEVDELAKTPNKEFTSPTLKGLLESAPRNLKGQALIDWTRANANKGIKPKEVEVLDLENYIKANPDQNVKEVVQGVKDKQIRVSKEIYVDDLSPEILFRVEEPKFDPLDPNIKNYQFQKDEILDDLDSFEDDLVIEFNQAIREQFPAAAQGKEVDTLAEVKKNIGDLGQTFDEFIDDYAYELYKVQPYELITPKSVQRLGQAEANVPDKTFAFGNDEVGYQLFIDGQRVTDPENIAYSQTEARIQLMNKLEEGGDPLRQVGEVTFSTTRYKDYIDESLPGGSNYREVVFRLDNVADGQFPKHDVTDHFQENDAISHALIRDRKLADGTDSLHIDELQSDLHTRGSKAGYLGSEKLQKTTEEISLLNKKLIDDAAKTKQKYEEVIPKISSSSADQLKLQRILDARFDDFVKAEPGEKVTKAGYIRDFSRNYLQGISDTGYMVPFPAGYMAKDLMLDSNKLNDLIATVNSAVPNYPFKDDWYVMSIKQLLQDAVKEGKSALSVSGSLPIKIRYTDAYSKFYESLYDQKIPSAMKKLANKYGGKFEKVNLNIKEVDQAAEEIGNNFFLELENKFLESDAYRKTGLNMDDNLQETRKLYEEFEDKYFESNTIRITPEMREKILKEGLDTFGTGGAVSNLGKAIENVDIFS